MPRPVATRPLVHARNLCFAAGDALSLALAFEGERDPRYEIALDEAEAGLREALRLIASARGPVPSIPPVPASVAARADSVFNLACAITGAAPLEEVA